MISSVELRSRDLESSSNRQTHAMGEMQPSDHQAGSDETLFLSVARTVPKKGGVQFHLGPEFFEAAILKCIIPQTVSYTHLTLPTTPYV